ncbi:hypothetical protein LOZ61_005655 [Ophidiomyces ophidiicola]|nr:hypothetical protein LOZ61_005655 [Ophidiomyces ophidiicola]KAI1924513.1 hypothetical protein LOZ60_004636 [Ophidiomyces ophidiicola]KAI2138317.1 hypothetical protein LOZ27_005577 [Ophidiomyces ophidiicola]KAI2372871.1 hypothetical protein LOY89_003955 [Ophidiomyces ophidiicola]KAI2389802.1 hypothetical protein LOY90_005925 [Ophidiomyces ophidiicola]
MRQIEEHLKENLPWIGIDAQTTEPKRMLDFACGDGFLSHALRPYFSEIIGVDLAEGMVNKYNRRAREAGIPESQMRAVVGDLAAAQPDASLIQNKDLANFDLIITSMALHHIEDPQRAVNRLVERLRPGGTLVVIDFDAAKDGQQWIAASAPAAHTITHHGFSKATMENLLTSAGCKDVEYVLHKEITKIPREFAHLGEEKQLFYSRGRKE